MLLHKVRNYIEAQGLIDPGDRVLLAVSGGPDSVALLYLLHTLAPQFRCSLAAAHLDHSLRPESERDAALVEQHCHTLGVPLYTRRLDVASLAGQMKTSLEDAGRRARYEFFAELAARDHFSRIATAHHLDDAAETVLLHLLRGSGIRGLGGIRPLSGKLIRPLLSATKAELLSYLEAQAISFNTDASNQDITFVRNRIRHQLIPYLQQEFNPRIIEALNQLAAIARDEEEALELETDRYWPEVCQAQEPGEIILSQVRLSRLHPAYKRRIIRRTLSRMSLVAAWSLDDVDKVIALEHKPGSSCCLQLKEGVRITRAYDRLIFTTRPVVPAGFKVPVRWPGPVEVPGTGITLRLAQVERASHNPQPGEICLDLDRLPDQLWIRSRQAGDVFRPLGMEGRKQLKKWFIDRKIPVADRDRIPLLAGAGGEIYAIWGHGVARTAAVESHTRNLLVISRIGPQGGS